MPLVSLCRSLRPALLFRKAVFAALSLLLIASPLAATAGGGPKPPSPPHASEDYIMPICLACAFTGAYCTVGYYTSVVDAPCVSTILNTGLATATGVGCTDNRYRDSKLVGAMQPVATPKNFQGGSGAGVVATNTALGLTEDPLIEKEMDLGYQSNDGVPGNSINYKGVQGAMPNSTDFPQGMAHKDTPAISIVMGYPWLWKETDQAVQYTLYRGTGNNTYADVDSPQPFRLAEDDDSDTAQADNDASVNVDYIASDIQCQAPLNTCTCAATSTSSTTCKTETNTTASGTTTSYVDYSNIQYWTRLSRDSCTNQYIIPLGLNPHNVFNEGYRNDAYPWNEQYCQPLITTPVVCKLDLINDHKGHTCLPDKGEHVNKPLDELNLVYFGTNSKGKANRYDYRAWGYLEKAWQDVLYNSYTPANSDSKNPNILGGSSATLETTPKTGGGKIYLKNPIKNESKFGCATATGNCSTTSGSGSSSTAIGFNYADPGSAPSGEGGSNSKGNYGYNSAFSGNLTRIDELAQRPYERIFDPTHPFTPRWDMTGKTDRDMSNSTSIYQFGPLPDFWDGYSTLDIPAASGVMNGTVGQLVRCGAVPVDILTFRADEFNACMKCRIRANSSCFWDEYWFNNIPLVILCQAGGDCSIPDPATALLDVVLGTSPSGPWAFFDDTRCKTILRQKSITVYNQWGESGRWPPCSVSYDYPFDNRPGLCGKCVKEANDYNDNDNDDKGHPAVSEKNYRLSGVTKCCADLAQPVAPINILKLRTVYRTGSLLANAGDPDRQVTMNGNTGFVPEGYRFTDYFPSGHMPYMRWWDTGASAGGNSGIPGQQTLPSNSTTSVLQLENWNDPLLGTNYNPNCNWGKDDIIVGVGTESNGADNEPYGMCRYGGGGGKAYLCINVGVPKGTNDSAGNAYGTNVDRLTSWYELKQYQVNALRDFGLDCLPMQEKMWKWMSAEDGALYQAGKHFNSLVHEQNDPTSTTQSDTTNTLYELKTNPWPLRWRGWLTDETDAANATSNKDKYIFPNFDAQGNAPASGSTFVGLDNAQRGDIIYITHNDAPGAPAFGIVGKTGSATEPTTPSNSYPVFPFVAVVTSAWHNGLGNTTATCLNANNITSGSTAASGVLECTDMSATCSDYIEVVDVNNGKYPDVCGNTDYVGMGQTRRIYKEWLPPPIQDALFTGGSSNAVEQDSCHDMHTIVNIASMATGALKISAAGNCEDPKYSACTFSTGNGNGPGAWNQINVYRPSLDERGHVTAATR